MAFELVLDEQLNTDYAGEVTVFTYSFTVDAPDQFLAGWIATKAVNSHADALIQEGSLLCRLQLYEDKTSGTLTTNFLAKVWAAGHGTGTPGPISSLPVNIEGIDVETKISGFVLSFAIIAVITLVLLVVGYLVVNSILKSVSYIIKQIGPIATTAISIAAAAIAIGGLLLLIGLRPRSNSEKSKPKKTSTALVPYKG